MNDNVMELVECEVLGWPGVGQAEGRFESVVYTVGRREIGHIHRDGIADLPFPKGEHDELIAAGKASPHRAGVAERRPAE